MKPDGERAPVGPAGAVPLMAGASPSPAPALHRSASYSITMRVRLVQRPGAFARVAGAIGETGAILGAIDLVRVERGEAVRDVTVACVDAAHGEAIVAAVGDLDGVIVEHVSDRKFLMHLSGKIEVNATIHARSRRSPPSTSRRWRS
jgi:malate dehydrogenase (oxaloacetate-decarboxylating)